MLVAPGGRRGPGLQAAAGDAAGLGLGLSMRTRGPSISIGKSGASGGEGGFGTRGVGDGWGVGMGTEAWPACRLQGSALETLTRPEMGTIGLLASPLEQSQSGGVACTAVGVLRQPPGGPAQRSPCPLPPTDSSMPTSAMPSRGRDIVGPCAEHVAPAQTRTPGLASADGLRSPAPPRLIIAGSVGNRNIEGQGKVSPG